MAFKFFNREDKNVPPDVGREETPKKGNAEDELIDDSDGEEVLEGQDDGPEEEVEKPKKGGGREKGKEAVINGSGIAQEKVNLEFQKVGARLESMNELIKGYGERIFNLSEQLGEIRAMTLANEKSVGKLGSESEKAIDIVREVKPEKLRIDFQRLDLKIEELSARIESNKQFMETIMNELKDIRRKVGTFIGTEELLRLNEDIKKDLIQAQQMVSKATLQADKTEQLFAEVKRNMSGNKKLEESVDGLEASLIVVNKEMQKLKVDFSNIVRKEDLDDFEKRIDKKVAIVNSAVNEIEGVKNENERVGRIVETMIYAVQKNQKDIADIALTIGDDHIKNVSDYDARLSSLLNILDALAGRINLLEKKSGIKGKRFYVQKQNKNGFGKLKNIDLHPQVSKQLSSKPVKVSKKMAQIQEESRESIGALDKSLENIDKSIDNQKKMLKNLTLNSGKKK